MTNSKLKKQLMNLISKFYDEYEIDEDEDICFIIKEFLDEVVKNYKTHIEKDINAWASSIIIATDDFLSEYTQEVMLSDEEVLSFFNTNEKACNRPIALLINRLTDSKDRYLPDDINKGQIIDLFSKEIGFYDEDESNFTNEETLFSIMDEHQKKLNLKVEKWIDTFLEAIQKKDESYEEEDISFIYDTIMTFTNLSYLEAENNDTDEWNTETVKKVLLESIPANIPMDEPIIEITPNILSSFFRFIQSDKKILKESKIKDPIKIANYIDEHKEEFKKKSKNPENWSKVKKFTLQNMDKLEKFSKGGSLSKEDMNEIKNFEDEFMNILFDKMKEELIKEDEEREKMHNKKPKNLSKKSKQILKKQKVTKETPGDVVKEMETLLNYVKSKKVKLTKSLRKITLPQVKELNSLIDNTMDLDKPRAKQLDYPYIDALYSLAIISKLCIPEGKNTKYDNFIINEPVYNNWKKLNDTEKYFSLLEVIIKSEKREIFLEEGFFNDMLWFLPNMEKLFDKCRLNSRNISRNTIERQFYRHVNLFMTILHLFGFINIETEKLEKGGSWKIKKIMATDYGKAFYELIKNIFSRGDVFTYDVELIGEEIATNEDIEKDSGMFMKEIKKYFPELKKRLTIPKTEGKKGTYIFKVFLYKDVWRKIALSCDDTLDDLAFMILDVFDFDDTDHMYEFKIGRGFNEEVYHHPYSQSTPSADSVTLKGLDIKQGTRMIFIFDFGDWWEFFLELESIIPQNKKKEDDVLLESKGKAPPQYDYDEDDDEDWDYDEDWDDEI